MSIVAQRAIRHIYLNREPASAWSGFHLTGLERLSDGTLSLVRAPEPIGTIGTPTTNGAATPPATAAGGGGTATAPGPAGVSIDCGDIYASDPAAHQVSRFNSCLAQPGPLPCAGGKGPWPGQLNTPRGLAVLPGVAGPQLAVAEEGNDRVQVFDLATGQSLFVVGKTGPDGTPQPGNGPGEFNAPWGLAADAAGNLYVADHGNARVQKLGPRGCARRRLRRDDRAAGGAPEGSRGGRDRRAVRARAPLRARCRRRLRPGPRVQHPGAVPAPGRVHHRPDRRRRPHGPGDRRRFDLCRFARRLDGTL